MTKQFISKTRKYNNLLLRQGVPLLDIDNLKDSKIEGNERIFEKKKKSIFIKIFKKDENKLTTDWLNYQMYKLNEGEAMKEIALKQLLNLKNYNNYVATS